MHVDRAKRFDTLYATEIDPWGFRTAAYERAKYQATLRALPHPRYRLCVEAGCSIGELTRMLAGRCQDVIGIDVSQVALDEAARRNADLASVSFRQGELPAAWPAVNPDLVVLSEILYFLKETEIAELVTRMRQTWLCGHCILVNYLGSVPYALQGRHAAELFIHYYGQACHISRIVKRGYQIDVLTADHETIGGGY